jgi:hypothetical protein
MSSSLFIYRSQPEVGGVLVRLPLEAELFKNYKHSMTGAKLRQVLTRKIDESQLSFQKPHIWFTKAQKLIEREMREIVESVGEDESIDADELNDERAEVLKLYLEYQESWQEVCLCLQRDEKAGTASIIVLNRPMAFQLTDHLARLCLYGTLEAKMKPQSIMDEQNAEIIEFMLAFRQECAVYIGGAADHDKPAEIVHGIPNLTGAVEISPGTGIYRGGLQAAVDGVLKGLYKPLDFRFFIGKYNYEDTILDFIVTMGKYQPIACSRSLVLKQCISLPKPLWHEILEVCGGEMKELSELEYNKKDGLEYEIVEEEEEEEDDDDDDGSVELDEVFDIAYHALEEVVGLAKAFDELFDEDDDEDDDEDYEI